MPPTPKHESLPSNCITELEKIWEKDKRLPTNESRKAWAKTRNVDVKAVNLWFYNRRMRIKGRLMKENGVLPKDQYVLPSEVTEGEVGGDDDDDDGLEDASKRKAVDEDDEQKDSDFSLGPSSDFDSSCIQRSSSPTTSISSLIPVDSECSPAYYKESKKRHGPKFPKKRKGRAATPDLPKDDPPNPIQNLGEDHETVGDSTSIKDESTIAKEALLSAYPDYFCVPRQRVPFAPITNTDDKSDLPRLDRVSTKNVEYRKPYECPDIPEDDAETFSAKDAVLLTFDGVSVARLAHRFIGGGLLVDRVQEPYTFYELDGYPFDYLPEMPEGLSHAYF